MIRRYYENRSDNQKERIARLLLLAALFFTCLMLFRSYLFGEELLVFNDIGSDTLQQYTAQFAGLIRHLREGTFSLWDFTSGFGVNEFNLNLFDPSLMVVYGLGYFLGSAKVLYYLVVIQSLRIMAAGWSFLLFSRCFAYSRRSRLAAAYIYGLCSYLLVWGQHYQFGMAVVYLPLLLLFTERTLQEKKSGRMLPVIVFLSCIYSAFFSYMSLLTVGIYLLVRLIMEEGWTWKKRCAMFVRTCLRILLGIGMSLAIFLPMALALLNISGRVSADQGEAAGLLEKYILPFDAGYYQSLFLRIFSSNLQESNGLKDGCFELYWNYYEDPVLFTSILTVFLDFQFLPMFLRKEKSRRKRTGVLLASILVLCALLIPGVGTVYNAFSYYASRFLYVLVPFFLLAFLWVFREVERGSQLNRPLLLLTGAAMTAAYLIGREQSVFLTARVHAVLLLICGIACMGILLLLQKRRFSGGRNLLLYALLLLAMASTAVDGSTNYADRITLRKSDTPAEDLEELQTQYDEDRTSGDPYREAYASLAIPQGFFGAVQSQNMNDALAWLHEYDPEFYRLEKDFVLATDYMDSLWYGYYGVSSYNSVLNQYVRGFIETCYPSLAWQGQMYHLTFRENVEDHDMAAFFGIRYILSRSSQLDPEKYELLMQFGDLYLYRNQIETSMARFYTETVTEEELRSAYREGAAPDLMTVLAVKEENISQDRATDSGMTPSPESETTITVVRPQRDDTVTAQLSAAEDGWVLFMIPYEDGWSLSIDGKSAEIIRGDLGFICCSVTEGEHEISLTFEAPGLKVGIAGGFFFCFLYFLWNLIVVLSRKKATIQEVKE